MADRYETIAAYLDGSLTGDERLRFEAEMQADAALAVEVSQWQANDAMLRAAFPIADGGVDAAMLNRLGLAEPKKLPIAANDNRWSWGRIGLAGGAIAASLAVAIVLLQPTAKGLADEQQFQIAMESLPSGQTINLASGNPIGPVLTFRARDGRYCREFAGDRVGGGIACRSEGEWMVEATSARGADTGNSNQIRTAAGSDPAALNAALDRLGASDPLNGENEKGLISSGWKE
ncbi:MAG: hypothetical protein WA793_14315 [Sphingorhabdus sp.]|uniref:hypothetical protein n=1 Tax=Sphingorhabdus sp. TaxID=1902408 RepID=UPI003CA10841